MSIEACGPYSQTLFLGASITSFSSSLGWNGDQGRLTVELVEDPCHSSKVYYDSVGNPQITTHSDFFNPPKMGSPVYFRFGGFSFGGILENWEEQVDVKGGKIYSVQVVDGMNILDSCQVIINNYTGSTFGVPNLINAFGYTEELNSSCNTSAYTSSLNPPLEYTPAAGFGGANVSDDGISWYQIRDAITVLSAFPSNYGGQLQLRDYRYYIDISELPVLDGNFRFNGDNLTISECISQVCNAVGMDYFTEILYFSPGSVPSGYGGIAGLLHHDTLKFIKVRTVARFVQHTSAYNVDWTVGSPIGTRLAFGSITQFVGDGTGRTRSSRGLELRSDITNSFLVGDNRQDLWQQAYTGANDTYTDTIWPFWGKDQNGFPIISNDINDDHNFTISTLGFGPDLIDLLGPTYNVTMIELRTLLTGMEEWSLYLHSEKPTIATALEMDSSFDKNVVIVVADAGGKPLPSDLKRTDTAAMKRAAKHAGINPDSEEIDHLELQKRLYDILRSYAELAGKKFMVSLPLICSAVDNSAPYSIKLNWEPSDGAWTDGNVQVSPLATALTQASPVLELLRSQDDGRIGCFVYFNTGDEIKLIDYSQISPDDVVPISDTECYVKGNVEEIIFLNPTARTYPRAIVTLNSTVSIKAAKESETNAKTLDALIGWLTSIPLTWFPTKAGTFGDDTNKLPLYPMPLLPQGAAVPLRSTNLSYGPWITTLSFGPASRTQYERDTSLSPWAFGSTQIMNYAGGIRVESQVTQQIVNESGSLTVPGAPFSRLGQVLINGGPEITNIDVEAGIGGITSTIRMRSFVPNFGELGRRRVQALRSAGTYQQKLQRAFLHKRASRIASSAIASLTRPFVKSDRQDRHSSHTLIVGQYVDDYASTGNNLLRTNVVMTDPRKALPEMYTDYDTKAFMDFGGLFRPFETSGVPGHNLPAFSSIAPSVSNPITSLSLNPFKASELYNGTSVGHDIEYIGRGSNDSGNSNYVSDISIKKAGSYGDNVVRGLGLRAPLVLVGWGFDTNGKPVPNATPGSPGTNFATNYLQKPNLWKAGPLDVRWDESKGIWSASANSTKRGILTGNLNWRSSALASGIMYNPTTSSDVTTEIITVFDHLLPSGTIIPANTNMFYADDGSGRKYIVSAACVIN